MVLALFWHCPGMVITTGSGTVLALLLALLIPLVPALFWHCSWHCSALVLALFWPALGPAQHWSWPCAGTGSGLLLAKRVVIGCILAKWVVMAVMAVYWLNGSLMGHDGRILAKRVINGP